jgi:hypothetical protein
MDFRARLLRIEELLPRAVGIVAETMSDEQISAALAQTFAVCGISMPPMPLSDETREILDLFWGRTFGHPAGLRVAGYSVFQLQCSLRQSAVDAGLRLADTFPAAEGGTLEDRKFLGAYRPTAGMEYRISLQPGKTSIERN